MTTFSPSEFKLSLERGTGRAALDIQAFWQTHAEIMRPALLHAITNDLRYDYQFEDNRALYLLDLIRLTGETAFFHAAALRTLYHYTEDNFHQLMEIARRLAQQGNPEARTALYATFEKEAARGEQPSGGDEIVLLDGAKGLLWLAEHYSEAARGKNGYDASDFDLFISIWEDEVGEAEAWRELDATCAITLTAFGWLQKWRTYRIETEQRNAAHRQTFSQRPRFSYQALRELIDKQGRSIYIGWSWGKKAAPEELERAALDLLAETDIERIIPMVRIFQDTPFLLDPAPLMEWAKSDDEQLYWVAQMALAEIESPVVREFALELLRGGQERDLPQAVAMLSTNHAPSDENLVLQALAQPMPTPFYRHSLCMNAKQFDEAHPSALSAELLITLYRETNCSSCRERIVSRLHDLNAIPDWIRAELPFGSDAAARKFA
jgi:hypothetical protein